MKDPSRLTRRRILSGMATIGSIGAVSGVGTVSLYADKEAFTGNLLSVGELDLKLCWGEDGEPCTPTDGPVNMDFGSLEKGDSGTATIQCSIDDNPGWTWLRTNCPDRPCGVQGAVTVSLWYDTNCDGEVNDDESYVTVELTDAEREVIGDQLSVDVPQHGIAIENLPLCDALTLLRTGTVLDHEPGSDTVGPFQPDSWCCLGFEWNVGEYICVEDSFELSFEFYTQQWRHNPEPRNPWPDASDCTVDCTEPCEDCSPKQGISFVAFCIENGRIDEGDITLRPFYDVEGEVYKVQWWSVKPLEWVVLYYGSNEGKYFENFHVEGETEGVVHVNSPKHESKLSWKDKTKGGKKDRHDTTDYGQCPSDPCPNVSGGLYGCGVKYNFGSDVAGTAGEWDSVCGKSCPGEDGKGGG